jgi:hypothetical protein
MRDELRDALVNLEREARAVGRADLVHHVEGVWHIIESICQKIDEEPRRRPSSGGRKGDAYWAD